MKRRVGLFLICALVSSPAIAQGALDDLDYCVKEKQKFRSSREAIESKIRGVQSKLSGWHKNPDTLPAETLKEYRDAVRAYAFTVWKSTANGKAVINSWNTQDTKVITDNFYKFIYPAQITEDQEKLLAKALFKKDYEENVKPKLDAQVKTVNAKVAEGKKELDGACKSDVVSQLFRVSLGNLIKTVGGNFEAVKNESGFGAQIVRATTGVSITDIVKYGIVGSDSSELSKINKTFNKALEDAGLGKSTVVGQMIQVFNPANIHLLEIKIPDKVDTTITIDSGTVPNIITNITGGIIKW